MEDSPLRIDVQTGLVALPTGYVIGPDLTREEFLSEPHGKSAQTTDNATLLFLHARFQAGVVDSNPLLANACFFDETIVYLDLTVNLYPPHATDWSSYSLDTEAAIKSMHDHLLTDQLGEPTSVHELSLGTSLPAQAVLGRSLEWKFPWGRVLSFHDSKGGGTTFRVEYGDRLAEANRQYHQRVKP